MNDIETTVNYPILRNIPQDENISAKDLIQINVPTTGKHFILGIGEPVSAIRGIIISHRLVRALYEHPFDASADAEENQPVCVGYCGKGNINTEGGEFPEVLVTKYGVPNVSSCADCVFNQFKTSISGSGKGKACRERRRLLFWLTDKNFPVIVNVPPTSLRYIKSYLLMLHTDAFLVETEITLTPVQGRPPMMSFGYVKDMDQSVVDSIKTNLLLFFKWIDA